MLVLPNVSAYMQNIRAKLAAFGKVDFEIQGLTHVFGG